MALVDFDYLATRNEIIQGAFRIVGALDPDGQNMTAEMLDQGVQALQLLVKSWSNKNIFLWSYNLSQVSTVAAQASLTSTLDQTIIGLDEAWCVDANDNIPLEVISWRRYLDIVDRETATGRPTTIAFKSTPAPTVYFWPVPDAIYTIKMLCVFPLKDFDDANLSGDVPVRFQRALKYGLAEDLFDEYPGPMNERQYVQGKAATLFREAKIGDMPAETTNEVEGYYSRYRSRG